MFAWIASPEAWIALATLTALEIVLGIDNIIFISILVGRLPAQKRSFARNLGLMLAMVTRLALLFSIVWVANLTQPWFTLFGQDISGRDIILIGGGLFLHPQNYRWLATKTGITTLNGRRKANICQLLQQQGLAITAANHQLTQILKTRSSAKMADQILAAIHIPHAATLAMRQRNGQATVGVHHVG